MHPGSKTFTAASNLRNCNLHFFVHKGESKAEQACDQNKQSQTSTAKKASNVISRTSKEGKHSKQNTQQANKDRWGRKQSKQPCNQANNPTANLQTHTAYMGNMELGEVKITNPISQWSIQSKDARRAIDVASCTTPHQLSSQFQR